MNGFRKNLLQKLRNKVFRDEYVAENVRTGIAYQIKAIREQRGWTQAHLAKLTGKKQSNIARLEDPDYGKFGLQTLLDVASAFDVWLSIEFVSFSSGLARTHDRSPGALGAEPFTFEFGETGKTSVALRNEPPFTAAPLYLLLSASSPEWDNHKVFVQIDQTTSSNELDEKTGWRGYHRSSERIHETDFCENVV